MLNEQETFLDRLRSLKDKIDIIQEKRSEGVIQFFSNSGIIIQFNYRALPRTWAWAGTSNKNIEVMVIANGLTTFYVEELNGNEKLTTRLLTGEDKDFLARFYECFEQNYHDNVNEFLRSDVYCYGGRPSRLIDKVLKQSKS